MKKAAFVLKPDALFVVWSGRCVAWRDDGCETLAWNWAVGRWFRCAVLSMGDIYPDVRCSRFSVWQGVCWHQIQFTEQLHASLPSVHTLLFCEAERRGPLLIGVIKAPFEAFKSPRNSKPDYWGGQIGTRLAKLDLWASCVFFSSYGVSLGVHLRILLCHSCVKFPWKVILSTVHLLLSWQCQLGSFFPRLPSSPVFIFASLHMGWSHSPPGKAVNKADYQRHRLQISMIERCCLSSRFWLWVCIT